MTNASPDAESGTLSGVKVVDCTRLLPGGFCTMLLADLGADVLKVEEPGRGDYIREFPPFQNGQSSMHLLLNRNKRSITLNLKSEPGREILTQLARDADIVVESFRPGVMDRLGVGYETLKAVNPGLVYCAITGFGQDGPYATRPGHDINYMGIAGALELLGRKGSAPPPPGLTCADLGGGAQMALIGILAALLTRQRTGKGQFVDISMTDGVISWLVPFAGWYFGAGLSPRGREHVLLGQFPCYDVYSAADGHLTVGCLEPHFWANLCNALERPEFIQDQYNPERAEATRGELASIFRQRTRAEWEAFLADKNVCVGPSYTIEEAMGDPQNCYRAMFTQMDHPTAGRIPQLGFPIKLSATPGRIRSPAPGLGQHTDEVLRELGYADGTIATMRDEGVV